MKVKTIIKKLKIPFLCAELLLPRTMVADNEVGPSPTDVPSSIGSGSGFVEGTTDSIDDDGTNIVMTDNPGAKYTDPIENITVTLRNVTYIFNRNKIGSFGPIEGTSDEVDTAVLFAPAVPHTLQNRQRILGGLAQAFKNENGLSAIVVPTIVKGIVIEKTVALGIPAGLIVAENPFEGNTNTLTPTGAEFFNDIKLYGGDLAVAVGAQAKANAVAAQLVKNGVNSEQILVVPAAHMNNPNTVAVYVVRLPTMADLFVPVQATS